MQFKYPAPSGVIMDGTYRQFGHIDPADTEDRAIMVDLQFRLATNGVIVNTLVNDEPLITTSAGLFAR